MVSWRFNILTIGYNKKKKIPDSMTSKRNKIKEF